MPDTEKLTPVPTVRVTVVDGGGTVLDTMLVGDPEATTLNEVSNSVRNVLSKHFEVPED